MTLKNWGRQNWVLTLARSPVNLKMATKKIDRHWGATFAYNLIFGIVGTVTMVISFSIVQDEVGKISGAGASTGLLLIGSLIVVTSALGTQASCTGDYHRWSFLYSTILLFVLVTTLILCVVVFQDAAVKENLSSGWNIVDLEIKRTVQSNLKCCGFNKISDRIIVPCNYVEPCEPKLHVLVDARMATMRSCVFALLGLELVGFVISIVVWCKQSPHNAGTYGGGSGTTTRSSNNNIQFYENVQ